MPMYTYKCPECGTFTRIVKIAARDEQKCEKGHDVLRGIDRPGAVYAPTSTGGGMKV